MVYTDGSHLIADEIAELHTFALEIGLKKGWFKNIPRNPHYFVSSKRIMIKAVKHGAKKINGIELLQIVNNNNR